MRLCGGCGFDSAPDDGVCPLCGLDAGAPTLIDPDALEITVRGGRAAEIAEALSPGDTFGRYQVERKIGRGGMGTVYEVIDLQSSHRAALKILHPGIADDESGVLRFKREVAILATIDHPAVPRVLDWGMEAGHLYFVAELVRGSDLRVLVREGAVIDVARAVEIAAAVAEALTIAHEHGIVHRDVKPHNIMITETGAVRLLDFGIARGAGIDMKTITATGALLGTPEYMSPEQFLTNRVDLRSDIYSLGVVVFEMLTGRRPFQGETPISIALKHKSDPPPVPRSIRKDIPMWLDRIVLRCLAKDPAARFQSAADLARELRRPRSNAPASRRRLPNGDWVIEDDSEAHDWALVLSTPALKTDWNPGRAVRFRERLYRLDFAQQDAQTQRWIYSFSPWPEEEVVRGLSEYDETAAEPSSAVDALKARIRGLMR